MFDATSIPILPDRDRRLPSEMGRQRYPNSNGYVRQFGDDSDLACTCTEDCVYRYCTGSQCGCEGCALRLEVELEEKKARDDTGFLITYERAVLMFGQNVADEYAADFASSDTPQ